MSEAVLSDSHRCPAQDPCSRQNALESWYRSYHATLIQWISHRVGDRDAAQDISQNAFLYLHFLAARTEVAYPRAVLFKTAGWLASNELRRRRRSKRNCTPIEDMPPAERRGHEVAREPSPEACAWSRQEAAITLGAIEALPEKAREAFRMSRMEGLTYGEIARRMQISKSSVEKHMILALKKLRAAKLEMD